MSRNMPPVPQTFEEFWPYYMAAHQDRRNRWAHYIGSAGALAATGGLLVTGSWWLLPAGLVWGYGCAWFGHFVFERNRPASWVRARWSLMGDWRMFFMAVTGREREAVALGHDLPDIVAMVRAGAD
jgi:hypothetical protein